jgi:hypothetical protein
MGSSGRRDTQEETLFTLIVYDRGREEKVGDIKEMICRHDTA